MSREIRGDPPKSSWKCWPRLDLLFLYLQSYTQWIGCTWYSLYTIGANWMVVLACFQVEKSRLPYFHEDPSHSCLLPKFIFCLLPRLLYAIVTQKGYREHRQSYSLIFLILIKTFTFPILCDILRMRSITNAWFLSLLYLGSWYIFVVLRIYHVQC